jgi:alpha-beta hydrolase superfamily lysophospholipase
VRIDAWEGAEDLEEMSLNDLHQMIEEACVLLTNNGRESIDVLGKSICGMLALTYPDKNSLGKMVLWAPAVGIGENNVDKWRSTLLEHTSTPTDISINRKYLEKPDVPTLIVHGTEDEVVDSSNSRKICEGLPECECKLIEGADHSSVLSRKM